MTIKQKISRPKGCDKEISLGMKLYASKKDGKVQARKRGGENWIHIGHIQQITREKDVVIFATNPTSYFHPIAFR